MNGYTPAFCAALALASLLAVATPAAAQTVNNFTLIQPSSSPHTEAMQAQADQAQTEAPEEQHKAAAPHHKKHNAHHKHHAKKKTTHKSASAARKPHKKSIAHAGHKPKSKLAAQHPHGKGIHAQRLATLSARGAKTKKPAPDARMAAVPPAARAAAPVKTASAASKTVTYDFCLGYDNCIPHRFEATVQGGKEGAKVLQQSEGGNWTEASLDPVMMSDLGKLARAEPQGRTERSLTPEEKAVIADHQGKMHATLVSEVEGGSAQKEQVKRLMREINIQNLHDLDAYDPRLRRRDVAVEAVNEISVGR